MHNSVTLFILSLHRQNINVTYMLGMHSVLLLNSHPSWRWLQSKWDWALNWLFWVKFFLVLV